ncbi:WXG100 family type VII secretion target [Amycolatopsis sp. WAC 01375]|uniref:WXG100 family type VII secretion target n=1 Tax=unclassified Amycolatopsis TaxID=2618356 RepID=UPI000F78B96C|nr:MULTISPECIES: WXG100 family type VII secretion target [unclassified Amycolatopsis]RSM71167.1 WXG100 family type VII secretion target [Amycolatopsis sp. WAC 01375]RSN35948.1 WXG100 family type VII secretion target [Amycolatopsis sp. WAC 01416]
MGEMKVDYATIHAAADDCKNTGGELEGLFGQLKSDLAPLVNTWDGDAKVAYMAAQQEWDNKFEELKQLLAQVAGVLPQLADGYQSTEQGVTGLF